MVDRAEAIDGNAGRMQTGRLKVFSHLSDCLEGSGSITARTARSSRSSMI
jgi:hypothetical protein